MYQNSLKFDSKKKLIISFNCPKRLHTKKEFDTALLEINWQLINHDLYLLNPA